MIPIIAAFIIINGLNPEVKIIKMCEILPNKGALHQAPNTSPVFFGCHPFQSARHHKPGEPICAHSTISNTFIKSEIHV